MAKKYILRKYNTNIRNSGLFVFFKSNLSFDLHIELIVRKALCMLGFLKRVSYNFNNTQCLKSLYFAIVLSITLRNSVNRSHNNYILASYLSRCNNFFIKSLRERKENLCIMFVFDILSGK